MTDIRTLVYNNHHWVSKEERIENIPRKITINILIMFFLHETYRHFIFYKYFYGTSH
jgi:hypothetical protein